MDTKIEITREEGDSKGRYLAVVEGHEAEINKACFSPRGDKLLTASSDNTVRVWDALDASPARGGCLHH